MVSPAHAPCFFDGNHRLMATWRVRLVDVPITLLRVSNDAKGDRYQHPSPS
jgi:hypothetical protein